MMKTGKLIVAAAVLFALPLAANAAKAPFVVGGKAYDLTGNMIVKGKARCGKFAAAGGGKSKEPLAATIQFAAPNDFVLFNDTLAPYGVQNYGKIVDTKNNGKKLILSFTDSEHATALLSISSVGASAPNTNGVAIGTTHSVKAVVSDKKMKFNEKVVMSFSTGAVNGMACTYKYIIGRKMKGVPTVPTDFL